MNVSVKRFFVIAAVLAGGYGFISSSAQASTQAPIAATSAPHAHSAGIINGITMILKSGGVLKAFVLKGVKGIIITTKGAFNSVKTLFGLASDASAIPPTAQTFNEAGCVTFQLGLKCKRIPKNMHVLKKHR